MDLFSIKGKKAIITGGANGIGKCIAKAFARAGADVALVDINEKGMEDLATELQCEGIAVMTIKADVTNKDEVQAMADNVEKTFGTIDILFNNAGICINECAQDMAYESWSRIIDINLNGVFLVAQAVGRVMIKNKSGSIINTASIAAHAALRPQPQVGYNASKAGVLLITQSLAVEWAPYGVRVNSISPGYIMSDMIVNSPNLKAWRDYTPMGRLGEAKELAGAVIYLASDAASYTTGTDIAIDGGYTAI